MKPDDKKSDGRRSSDSHNRYDRPSSSHSPAMSHVSDASRITAPEFLSQGFPHPRLPWLDPAYLMLMQSGLQLPIPPLDLFHPSTLMRHQMQHGSAAPPSMFAPPHVLSPAALAGASSLLHRPSLFQSTTSSDHSSDSPICLVQSSSSSLSSSYNTLPCSISPAQLPSVSRSSSESRHRQKRYSGERYSAHNEPTDMRSKDHHRRVRSPSPNDRSLSVDRSHAVESYHVDERSLSARSSEVGYRVESGSPFDPRVRVTSGRTSADLRASDRRIAGPLTADDREASEPELSMRRRAESPYSAPIQTKAEDQFIYHSSESGRGMPPKISSDSRIMGSTEYIGRESSRTPSVSDIAAESRVDSCSRFPGVSTDDINDTLSDGRQSRDGSCFSVGIDPDMSANVPRSSICLPIRKRIPRMNEEHRHSVPSEDLTYPAPTPQPSPGPSLATTSEAAPAVEVPVKLSEDLHKEVSSKIIEPELSERIASPKPEGSNSPSLDSPSSSLNFRSVWKKFAAKSAPTNAAGTNSSSGLTTSTGMSRLFSYGTIKPMSFGGKPYHLMAGGGKPRGFFSRAAAAAAGRPGVKGIGKLDTASAASGGSSLLADGSTSPRVTRSQSRRKKKDSPKHSPNSEEPQAPVRKSVRKKTANSKYDTEELEKATKKGKRKDSTHDAPSNKTENSGSSGRMDGSDDSQERYSATSGEKISSGNSTELDKSGADTSETDTKGKSKDKSKRRIKDKSEISMDSSSMGVSPESSTLQNESLSASDTSMRDEEVDINASPAVTSASSVKQATEATTTDSSLKAAPSLATSDDENSGASLSIHSLPPKFRATNRKVFNSECATSESKLDVSSTKSRSLDAESSEIACSNLDSKSVTSSGTTPSTHEAVMVTDVSVSLCRTLPEKNTSWKLPVADSVMTSSEVCDHVTAPQKHSSSSTLSSSSSSATIVKQSSERSENVEEKTANPPSDTKVSDIKTSSVFDKKTTEESKTSKPHDNSTSVEKKSDSKVESDESVKSEESSSESRTIKIKNSTSYEESQPEETYQKSTVIVLKIFGKGTDRQVANVSGIESSAVEAVVGDHRESVDSKSDPSKSGGVSGSASSNTKKKESSKSVEHSKKIPLESEKDKSVSKPESDAEPLKSGEMLSSDPQKKSDSTRVTPPLVKEDVQRQDQDLVSAKNVSRELEVDRLADVTEKVDKKLNEKSSDECSISKAETKIPQSKDLEVKSASIASTSSVSKPRKPHKKIELKAGVDFVEPEQNSANKASITPTLADNSTKASVASVEAKEKATSHVDSESKNATGIAQSNRLPDGDSEISTSTIKPNEPTEATVVIAHDADVDKKDMLSKEPVGSSSHKEEKTEVLSPAVLDDFDDDDDDIEDHHSSDESDEPAVSEMSSKLAAKRRQVVGNLISTDATSGGDAITNVSSTGAEASAHLSEKQKILMAFEQQHEAEVESVKQVEVKLPASSDNKIDESSTAGTALSSVGKAIEAKSTSSRGKRVPKGREPDKRSVQVSNEPEKVDLSSNDTTSKAPQSDVQQQKRRLARSTGNASLERKNEKPSKESLGKSSSCSREVKKTVGSDDTIKSDASVVDSTASKEKKLSVAAEKSGMSPVSAGTDKAESRPHRTLNKKRSSDISQEASISHSEEKDSPDVVSQCRSLSIVLRKLTDPSGEHGSGLSMMVAETKDRSISSCDPAAGETTKTKPEPTETTTLREIVSPVQIKLSAGAAVIVNKKGRKRKKESEKNGGISGDAAEKKSIELFPKRLKTSKDSGDIIKNTPVTASEEMSIDKKTPTIDVSPVHVPVVQESKPKRLKESLVERSGTADPIEPHSKRLRTSHRVEKMAPLVVTEEELQDSPTTAADGEKPKRIRFKMKLPKYPQGEISKNENLQPGKHEGQPDNQMSESRVLHPSKQDADKSLPLEITVDSAESKRQPAYHSPLSASVPNTNTSPHGKKKKPVYSSPSDKKKEGSSSTGQMKYRFVKVGREWMTVNDRPSLMDTTDESNDASITPVGADEPIHPVVASERSSASARKKSERKARRVTNYAEEVSIEEVPKAGRGRSSRGSRGGGSRGRGSRRGRADSAWNTSESGSEVNRRRRSSVTLTSDDSSHAPPVQSFTIDDLHNGLLRLGYRTLLMDGLDERYAEPPISPTSLDVHPAYRSPLSLVDAVNDDYESLVSPTSTFCIRTELEILMEKLTVSPQAKGSTDNVADDKKNDLSKSKQDEEVKKGKSSSGPVEPLSIVTQSPLTATDDAKGSSLDQRPQTLSLGTTTTFSEHITDHLLCQASYSPGDTGVTTVDSPDGSHPLLADGLLADGWPSADGTDWDLYSTDLIFDDTDTEDNGVPYNKEAIGEVGWIPGAGLVH